MGCQLLDRGRVAAVGRGRRVEQEHRLPPPSNLPGGLEDGKAYDVSARAFDRAANTQTATTANAFIFDVSSPAVANVLPLHGARYKSLPMLSGTAADQAPGAFNVAFPLVRIYDISLNRYWYSGAWQTAAFPGFPDLWNTSVDSTSVAGVFTWRYDASAVTWTDRDNLLRVETRALDAAGNFNTASSTFSFDATRPGSSVLYLPLSGVTYSTMAVIAGTRRTTPRRSTTSASRCGTSRPDDLLLEPGAAALVARRRRLLLDRRLGRSREHGQPLGL